MVALKGGTTIHPADAYRDVRLRDPETFRSARPRRRGA
jgi:hypothetical protein